MSRRLKSLAGLVVDQADRGELPYLALEHLEGGAGAIVPDLELPCRRGGEPGSSAVRCGDVLFGKLRPYLAKTFLVREPAYASTELMALRPNSAVEARYLAYLVGSRPIIEWATASSDGSKMPRTSWEKLGEFRLNTLPDLATQRAIADYLDTETARIDALITKKQRMLTVSDERRRSRVESLLAPPVENAGSWRKMRLRHVCREITVGVVVEPSSYFTESGVPFIHGTDVLEGRIDEGNFKFISPASNARLYKSKVSGGDVLAMRVGEPGRASVVPAHLDGSNCASVLILRGEPALNGALLAAFLNSRRGRSQIEAMQYGAAQGVLNVAHAKEIVVDVPPPEDQGRMAAKLDELERYHSQIRAALGRQIDLLREHRQALITAAVTGELEVPGVAA